MRRAIPALHPYVFMAWYVVKHRDNFTFTCVFGLVGIFKPNDRLSLNLVHKLYYCKLPQFCAF